MRTHFTLTVSTLLLAFLWCAAGCQQSPQVGRPTVLQFQFMPADSENARPVQAERSDEQDAAQPSGKLADTLTWRDNEITVTVTTSGAGGDQSQQPTQETSPDTTLDMTP